MSDIIGMDIGEAIDAMRDGEKVARKGWNEKGMWLALQQPDANSKMTLPYIFMSTVTGDLFPWLASQTDILANDWEVVDPDLTVDDDEDTGLEDDEGDED